MATQPTPLPPEPVRPQLDEGGGDRASRRPFSNGFVAVIMLLVGETMLFTGLIGAYLFFRGSAPAWPPPGQPRLPILVTWANTAVLFASAVTMWLAVRAARRDEPGRARNALYVTGSLGTLFLVIQGSEWLQLIGHGLTAQSSTYGATFYSLIGLHGVHVLGGVAWLLAVVVRARRRAYERREEVALAAIYWYYVTGLWGALFALVYH